MIEQEAKEKRNWEKEATINIDDFEKHYREVLDDYDINISKYK